MKLNIQSKLQLPIIVVVVAVMSFSAYYTNLMISSSLEKSYGEELELLSASMLKTVNAMATQIKRDIVRLASEPGAVALLAYESANGAPGEERTRLQGIAFAMVKTALRHTGFEVVNVTRPDGLIVTGSAGTTTDKVNIGKRPYFQAALRGETYIGEPVLSMSTGHKIVSVATPVKDAAGKTIGVVSADLDCMRIEAATIEGVKVGKTGYAFIAGSETGLMIAHPDYDRVQKTKLGDFDWGKAVLQSKNGTHAYVNSETGATQRTVFRTDDASGWISAVTIQESEINEAGAAVRNVSIIVMVVGTLLVCLVVFLVMRPILGALQKTVVFSRAVAEGKLDEELPMRRSDEIGTLADALRTMVGRLKEHITAAERESSKAREESARAQAAVRDAETATRESQEKHESILRAADRLEDAVNIISSASG